MEQLSNFLNSSRGYQSPTPPSKALTEDLMVTCGASQGMQIVCTAFTKPGDVIFVESPTYFLALGTFPPPFAFLPWPTSPSSVDR